MCNKTPKKTSENQVITSLVVKTMASYVIDVEVSQTVASRVRLRTRNVTPLRKWGNLRKFAKVKPSLDQLCRNSFCEEEGKLSCQTSSEMEMGTIHGKKCLTYTGKKYYTRENMFNTSATWEYITVKNHRVKMPVDPSGDSTGIL